jgi:hypothetical protein
MIDSNDIKKAKELLLDGFKNKKIDEIKIPRFRLSDLKINPRNAVHWELKGIFLNKKSEGKWHLLNLTEATWILIVQKLRDFNFKLELINDLKENFLNQKIKIVEEKEINELKKALQLLSSQNIDNIIDSEEFDNFMENMSITILELIIMDILNLRNQYKILFTLKGDYVIIKDGVINNPLADGIDEIHSQSHFSLNINEILGDLLGKIDLDVAFSSYQMITKSELNILKNVRSEDVKSIEIKMNSQTKVPETIEVKKLIKPEIKSKIDQMIMKNGYQEITIKTQNGNITHCENTIKYKLDTE